MKKYSIKILAEDAGQFEEFIQYASNDNAIKADAKEFAEQNYDNEEEQIEWYSDFEERFEDGITLEDLQQLDLSDINPVEEDLQALKREASSIGDVQEFARIYASLYEMCFPEALSKEEFLTWMKADGSNFLETLKKVDWEGQSMSKGKRVGETILELYKELVSDSAFKNSWPKIKKKIPPPIDDSARPKAFPDPKGSDTPSSSEETDVPVEEVEDDLDDMDAQLDEFEQSLEDIIEKAYKAEDTEEYAQANKVLEMFGKYAEFIAKLFSKIIDFAKKKERQDVIDTTNVNVQVFSDWLDQRLEVYNTNIEAAVEDGMDLNNPTVKYLKVVIKEMEPIIKDFKKIVLTIKKDPLKKISEKNILESVRKDKRLLRARRLRR